jgi:alcohol dehydrogenase class IV
VVDPELLLTLPPRLTAESGMDALVQAVESASSIHATELTRALSVRAAALVAEGLPAACADGSDLAAREKCALGSLMAGIALANARLGVVHGLAHPLGARCRLAHGLICGALLPAALRLNAAAAAGAYGELERACGVKAAGRSAGERLAAWSESLLRRLGLFTDLSFAGVQRSDFGAIISEAMESGSLKANALRVTPDDLERMLLEVCGRGR